MAGIPLFSLDGRVALVTGASRGLGFAMAEALAEAGATVVLNSRHADTLEAAARKLRDRGFKVETAVFDVTEQAVSRAVLQTIVGQMGGLDILIANAGVTHRAALADWQAEDWDRMLATNVTACFFLAQGAAAAMRRQGYGRIIFTTSITGRRGRATIHSYVASTSALAGITRSLAAELGEHGVTPQCHRRAISRRNSTSRCSRARIRLHREQPGGIATLGQAPRTCGACRLACLGSRFLHYRPRDRSRRRADNNALRRQSPSVRLDPCWSTFYQTPQPIAGLKAGPYDLNLTRVSFPPQMPSNPPHHRSGGALYYVISGTGANTVEGNIESRTPGTFIYEPSGLVHQWGNPGNSPLTFLVFNINQEGVPAVVSDTPPKVQ
jgi:NADP-dependent 3-hydroxy acid dehydrogenase YdfG/quercetin dioxygenase-like cupin family protein